jgi:hypothetical protein
MNSEPHSNTEKVFVPAPLPSSLGRLVLVSADKGGTGKSTFTRGLLDIYRYYQIQCHAYDSDRRNAQLHRHYHKILPGVSQIDISTQGEADALLDNLKNFNSGLVLVDLPAGAGEWFERLETELDLIAVAATSGYRLTLVSVLSRTKDTIKSLQLLLNYCGDRVDYVAVKNLYYGTAEQFKQFDTSKTKAQFLELGGIEIAMPALFNDTYDLIDEKDLTFREAMEETSSLSRAHRVRVTQWLKGLEWEIRRAGAYLGLSIEGAVI